MVALENPTAQKRGLVHVQYEVGQTKPDTKDICSSSAKVSGYEVDLEYAQNGNMLADVLPVRMVGIHFCYDDIRLRLASSLFSVLRLSSQLRFKFHYGMLSKSSFLNTNILNLYVVATYLSSALSVSKSLLSAISQTNTACCCMLPCFIYHRKRRRMFICIDDLRHCERRGANRFEWHDPDGRL